MKLRELKDVYTDEERIQIIANLIEEGALDPVIRQTAVKILKAYNVKERDEWGEVSAIFDWVKKNIRYTKDIKGIDTYFTPKRLLEEKTGDCDCMTTLLGALLSSIGYEVGVRIISSHPDKPFHHIYLLVKIGNKWVPLDATNKSFLPGQEYKYAKKKDFKIILGA